MVLDAHADLLYDVTYRRLLLGESYVLERQHLPRLRKGGVEGLVLAVWTSSAPQTFWQQTPWAAPEAGADRMERMLECSWADLGESAGIRPVYTWAQAEAARAAGELYAFLAVEGMAALGDDPAAVERCWQAGIRIAMLTWNETNALATGAGGDAGAGLTAAGRRAVRQIQERGMLMDVSHLNDGGFWDVARMTQGPLIASHSNCRQLCDVPRNLTDDQLKAIRDSGGVVGLNVYHGFVHREPAWQTVETLARHAVHMAEVMGIDHVGCGFDFCEFMGPGNEGAAGLESAEGIPNLFFWLERMGMTPAEREQIAWGNFARVFGQVLRQDAADAENAK